MGMTMELFQSELISQKMEYFKKTGKKNLDWLFKEDLRLINDEDSLKSFIEELLASKSLVACDTETTGLSFDDKICGLSLAFKQNNKYIAGYIPMFSEIEKIGIPQETSLALLKPILESQLIWKNAKFDWKVLKKVGIDAGILADVSVMERITKAGLDDIEFTRLKRMSLKERYAEIFNEHMLDLEDVLGKNVHSFAFAPLEAMKLYAATDAFATLKLYEYLLPLSDTESFIYKLETLILKPAAQMELNGITIDTAVLQEARIKLLEEQKGYEQQVYELSGEKFNLNSGPQLGGVLFNKFGLPCYKTTPGGEQSTDKDSLQRTLLALSKEGGDLKEEFKIGKQIIEILFKYKENEKLLTAFVDNLMRDLCSDNKVHTTYNTLGAISLRWSSDHPNLQNLPKSEDGNKAIIRKAFVASPGYYLISCDFSQVELRIGASFSQDPNMVESFNKDVDVHRRVASLMFGKPESEITKDTRKKAKELNFGLMYGMGPYKLSNKLSCSLEEATDLYNTYFSKLPKIKSWIKEQHKFISANGFSETKWGWKRMLPNAKIKITNWKDESPENKANKAALSEALREGLNHEIQGTSANITAIAIVKLDRALKGKDVKMLVQVHDQVIFEVNENILPDEIVPTIKECMELKLTNFVPLKVDTEIGYSWGNLVEWKPGMTQWDIPFKEKVIISGDVVGKSEELKKLLEEFKGENEVYFNVNGTIIKPDSVDNETGEVIETMVLASKKFIKKVEDLGLKVN